MFRGYLLIAGLLQVAGTAAAQEFRVYTKTYELTGLSAAEEARGPLIAKSLTLFHAGKVYDYIDSLQEVTIYEPVHRRFTILQVSSGVAATVSQDEVRQFLKMAVDETENVAASLMKSPAPEDKAALEFLQFQLRPGFRVDSANQPKRLMLESPRLRYEVRAVTATDADLADCYVRYADAIADLNSVLHPQALLPGPRLRLNHALREHSLLPVEVRRWSNDGAVRQLRAEHEWSWSLSDYDRKLLSRWEGLLQARDLKHVSFEQLQRDVLRGHVGQR